MNRPPFAPGEWYHCYNRGVDKRKVFMGTDDYERFMMLLYIANDILPVHLSVNGQPPELHDVLKTDRKSCLVDIGVYSLMPNHFHLLLRELVEGGISLFMQKISTAYTMYFNAKEIRTGSLFAGRFKSKHIANDLYLKRVVNYIHANQAELIEPEWKTGSVKSKKITRTFLETYPYSSLPDYLGTLKRREAKILNANALQDYYDDYGSFSIERLFADARDFAKSEKPFV